MSDAAFAVTPPLSVIRAVGLHKRFREGTLDVAVLQGIDLDIAAGETVAIVGASGSGKSTLLHLMGGLDAPTQGTVTLMGRDLQRLDAPAQGEWRNRHLGFVYQFHHLLPEFSALDNVAMPLRIRRVDQATARASAAVVLQQVGLGHRLDHRRSCRAASASAWPSPARWSAHPRACWPTSPPATSTAKPPTACST